MATTATAEGQQEIAALASGAEGTTGSDDEPRPVAPQGRWPQRTTALVLVLGLLVTAALALTAQTLYSHNEKRLLALRAREVGSVLSAVEPSTQTPLVAAATLADATNGSPRRFAALLGASVGPARQFAAAALWRADAPGAPPRAVIGTPRMASDPAYARSFLARVPQAPLLHVTGLLGRGADVRLGYAYSTPRMPHGFIAYTETQLPTDRRSRLQSNSAFSDLNYVLYIGRQPIARNLLVTNLSRLPARGRQASVRVPFGDATFLVVVTARGALGGTFFQTLPWIVAGAGLLLSLAAAALTARLVRRRAQAERLASRLDHAAEENRRLFAEQRDIAQTLQHSLLPGRLPDITPLQASARYLPGVAGIDVGGDWYDVVALEAGRLFIAVGDVSGRGLRAATTMAALRHASLAYAAQGDYPAALMSRLSGLVKLEEQGQFASMLCGVLDTRSNEITLASAGHLPPLLIGGDEARYLSLKVGPPIGVPSENGYEETTVQVPDGATLLAFTDGLVERRGENLDTGLERLRAAAVALDAELDELVGRLTRELTDNGSEDDTAILGLRWPE